MFRHARRQPLEGSAPFVRPHEAAMAFAEKDLIDQDGHQIRITVLDRPNCHLCARVEKTLEAVRQETGEGFRRANVDDYPELVSKYGEWIPVIFLDGRRFDYYQLDGARLISALTAR